MNHSELILIGSVGGGLGAWVRIVVRDEFVARGIASWRVVIAINLLGSALAGVAVRLNVGSFEWALFTLGFLGGFTTFSSMCVDVVVQWIVGRRRSSAIIVLSTMLGGPLVAWFGSMVAGGFIMRSAGPAVAIVPLTGRRLPHHFSGLLGIAAGGFVGTGLRISFQFLAQVVGYPVWTATALVNSIGAGFAGFVFRWLCSLDANGVPRHEPSRRLNIERLLIFGFAGGLTTVSTLAVEIVSAFPSAPLTAGMIGLVNLGCGVAAATIGWWIARRVFPERESFVAVHDSHSSIQETK